MTEFYIFNDETLHKIAQMLVNSFKGETLCYQKTVLMGEGCRIPLLMSVSLNTTIFGSLTDTKVFYNSLEHYA